MTAATLQPAPATPPVAVVQHLGRWLVVQPMRAPGLPAISWKTVHYDCMSRETAERLAAELRATART